MSPINSHPTLVNSHLEGKPFFLKGGPTGIVLSHGFTATSAEVRPLSQLFHKAGYTVAGPLLPGHGTDPQDLNQVTWQEWAEAVERSLQQTLAYCQQVFIGGESTGGLLALYLAGNYYPQVCGVLAYAPALRLRLTLIDQIRLYLLAPFIASVPKSDPDGNPRWQGYRVNPLKGTLQLLRLQKEVMHRLPAIRQPVLVIQGRLDTTVHPSVPALIQARCGGPVDIHWMEHSTHVVILDNELEMVSNLSLDFMQKNCSQALSNDVNRC